MFFQKHTEHLQKLAANYNMNKSERNTTTCSVLWRMYLVPSSDRWPSEWCAAHFMWEDGGGMKGSYHIHLRPSHHLMFPVLLWLTCRLLLGTLLYPCTYKVKRHQRSKHTLHSRILSSIRINRGRKDHMSGNVLEHVRHSMSGQWRE